MSLYAAQIVASLANEAAGPSYSVRRLAESLAERGMRSEVLSVGERASDIGSERVFPARLSHAPVVGRLLVSPALRAAVAEAAADGAVLHNHGLWLMPNVYPGLIAKHQGTPLIVSPRGMLGPAALQFSRLKKKVFWNIAQGPALRTVSCLHATAPEEAEDIRAFGLRAPIAVIPNGIDVPQERIRKRPRPSGEPRTLLHLGRIHPKKGIDRLLRAWARVEPAHPDWNLRIVGPDEGGHTNSLRNLARQIQLKRVTFDGPLYASEKQAAYEQADLFVLPTLNENFGMVVAEALANGIPAICSKGAPWAGLETERCGWWIDHGPEPMAAALDTALGLPDAERAAMGARGRAWMARDFGWDGIADRMAQVYAWCLGRGDRPGCVVIE